MKKKVVYTAIAAFVIIGAIGAIFGDTSKTKEPGKTKLTITDTLVNGTIADWRKATKDQHIALCARFIENLKKNDPETVLDKEQTQSAIVYLYNCMEPIASKSKIDDFKLSEIAASCMVLLKQTKSK